MSFGMASFSQVRKKQDRLVWSDAYRVSISMPFCDALYLATTFLLLQRLALVVLTLTTTKPYVELGTSVLINKQAQWYDGKTRRAGVTFQTVYLFLVQQKLPVAA